MGGDGQLAVSCIVKDLESLLVHYTFDTSYWRTLKTTNPSERIKQGTQEENQINGDPR
jgi:hypothetical protein